MFRCFADRLGFIFKPAEIVHQSEPGIIWISERHLNNVTCSCALLLALQGAAVSQETPKGIKIVFDYLSMAGKDTPADFQALSQKQQTTMFLKSLVNPILYFRGAVSAAIDQKNNKPFEWEQGGSGYGKRYGNIMGQYLIQRSVTFGVASLLHEDNRYFGSGKQGIWRRTAAAVSGSVLARHDNGKRYPSVSLIGGFAAAAFISRSWQPPSTRSAGDGAVSFGTSMGYNALACTVKEFLPDLLRPITKHRKSSKP